jgi:photosystem II stability/assembly factor-like uncharacterized protein
MGALSRSGTALDLSDSAREATPAHAGGPPRFFTLLSLQSGAVLAGTCGRGISRSDDGGRAWSPFDVPEQAPVNALANSEGQEVLAATSGCGLLRSPDEGRTWLPAGLDGTTLYAIATIEAQLLVGGEGVGVLRTADDGRTWRAVSGLPATTTVYRLLPLPSGGVFAGTAAAGVWRIDDGEARPSGLGDWSVFALAALDERRLLAGTRESGVHRSDDGGVTWVPSSTGLPDPMVHALLVDDTGAAFAGTGRGVARSDDGGRNWIAVGQELANHRIFSLARSPHGSLLAGSYEGVWTGDPERGAWVPVETGVSVDEAYTVIIGPGDVAYAGSRLGGLRSTDAAATWHPAGEGADVTTYAICCLASGSVLAGTDDGVVEGGAGRAWRSSGLRGQRVFCLAEVEPGRVLAGTLGSGVWSRSGREPWIEANEGLFDPMAFDLLPLSAGEVLLATGRVEGGVKTGGVSRSVDGGRSWQGTDCEATTVYRIVRNSTGLLFAGAQRSRILRSTTGGSTWQALGTMGLVDAKLFCLAIDTDDRLYLGSGARLLRSADAAATWDVIDDGLEGATVFDVAAYRSGILVAATSFGLYRSVDDGATWQPGGLGR